MLIFSRPHLIDHSAAAVDLTAGDIAIADLLAAAGLGIAGIHELINLGRSGRRHNKVIAEPCSDSIAEDATGTFAAWAGTLIGDVRSPDGATLEKLATGTVTIGAKTGIAGGLVDAAHRFGDTLVLDAAAGFYTQMSSAFDAQAVRAHSPADDTVAKLFLPEVGFADFIAIESIAGLKWRVRTGA